MNNKTLEVTIEKARSWYNSGNPGLIELAKSLYKEIELKNDETMSFIDSKICRIIDKEIKRPSQLSREKLECLLNLATIAQYYNGDWEKGLNVTGYFIELVRFPVFGQKMGYKVVVSHHKYISIPGTIYFKESGCAEAAIRILGSSKLIRLFKKKNDEY